MDRSVGRRQQQPLLWRLQGQGDESEMNPTFRSLL
jgi:hypothetical protein